jgi:hypothetical protein
MLTMGKTWRRVPEQQADASFCQNERNLIRGRDTLSVRQQ